MAASPSPLEPLLERSRRWRRVEHHREVGSTNDLAAETLRGGAPPGFVVTADRQTAGRGRRGRVWEDRPDGASVALSATVPTPAATTLVPLATGLAVGDALADLGVESTLKWPNDVLSAPPAPPGKLCGILAERFDEGVVIGIGINVDFRDAPTIEGATSVADVLGGDLDRWLLVERVLDRLDDRCSTLDRGDVATLLDDYRARCSTLGLEVVAQVGGEPVRGRAVDVDDAGTLLLEDGRGRRHAVTAGDVHRLRTV